MPQVLQAVLSLPESAHIAVRYTSISLVGELSEWIEHHPQLLGVWDITRCMLVEVSVQCCKGKKLFLQTQIVMDFHWCAKLRGENSFD